MASIDIVQSGDLLDTDPILWVSNDHGMVVISEDRQHTEHVMTYLRSCCTKSAEAESAHASDSPRRMHSDHGLMTPGGTEAKIYRECSDIFEVEFIFMIPVDMCIETAIHDVGKQMQQMHIQVYDGL